MSQEYPQCVHTVPSVIEDAGREFPVYPPQFPSDRKSFRGTWTLVLGGSPERDLGFGIIGIWNPKLIS